MEVLFVSLLQGDHGCVRGGGMGGKILVEALLMGFEGGFGGVGQVGDHKKSRQGAGRPAVVLGPERPTHFRHNNK